MVSAGSGAAAGPLACPIEDTVRDSRRHRALTKTLEPLDTALPEVNLGFTVT